MRVETVRALMILSAPPLAVLSLWVGLRLERHRERVAMERLSAVEAEVHAKYGPGGGRGTDQPTEADGIVFSELREALPDARALAPEATAVATGSCLGVDLAGRGIHVELTSQCVELLPSAELEGRLMARLSTGADMKLLLCGSDLLVERRECM